MRIHCPTFQHTILEADASTQWSPEEHLHLEECSACKDVLEQHIHMKRVAQRIQQVRMDAKCSLNTSDIVHRIRHQAALRATQRSTRRAPAYRRWGWVLVCCVALFGGVGLFIPGWLTHEGVKYVHQSDAVRSSAHIQKEINQLMQQAWSTVQKATALPHIESTMPYTLEDDSVGSEYKVKWKSLESSSADAVDPGLIAHWLSKTLDPEPISQKLPHSLDSIHALVQHMKDSGDIPTL